MLYLGVKMRYIHESANLENHFRKVLQLLVYDQNSAAQKTLTWTFRLGMGEWAESSDDIEQEKLCQSTDQ